MQYALIVRDQEGEYWVMADAASVRTGEGIPAGIKTFTTIEATQEGAQGRTFEVVPIEPNMVEVQQGWRRAYQPGRP